MNRSAPTIAIIIPARYGSTRFPGKPLAMLGERTMLSRVVDVAREAASMSAADVNVYVTTDDSRIADHAAEIGAECLMTATDCATGSDRVLAAARMLPETPDFIVNLQGDAPLTPPSVVAQIIVARRDYPAADVITPVHQLTWESLDRLRTAKQETPFSGTTAIVDAGGKALWFSKQIIPALRKEDRTQAVSPVHQHMGIYGYGFAALERFCALPQGVYEQLEGLEQLRFLENGMTIQTVSVNVDHLHGGIDSPEDLARAEKALSGS